LQSCLYRVGRVIRLFKSIMLLTPFGVYTYMYYCLNIEWWHPKISNKVLHCMVKFT